LIGTVRADTRRRPYPDSAVKLFRRWELPRLGTAGYLSPSAFFWVLSHAWKYDTVHVHLSRDLVTLPLAMLVSVFRPKALIIQTHGMVDPSSRRLARIVDRLGTHLVLRRARAVVILTRHERSDLLGVTKRLAPTVVLGNSIDPPEITAAPLRVPAEVIFLARLHTRKRPDLFVEMAVRLASEIDGVNFVLVGPDEGAIGGLLERVAAEGLGERIRWEGAISREKVFERMTGCTVYVLPAEHEPFGLTVIEALAVGTPAIVAWDAALAADIVAAECGSTFDGTADDLAVVVRSYVLDAAYRQIQSENATTFARRFSRDGLSTQLEEIYAYADRNGEICRP
tara:strand:+ start:2761 stop:3780 length:1020 start_codon:yes stop_codon:yes gene_type:complete